jgi:sugar phosphate isomerase/epimerase
MLGPEDTVLWTTTVMQAPTIREQATAAGAAGYSAISVRFAEVDLARAQGHVDAEMRLIIEDLGLAVHATEPLVFWPPNSLTPDTRAVLSLLHTNLDSALEASSAYGAQTVTALQLVSDRTDLDSATEAFAHICERAAEFGLSINLEFLAWSGIGDLETATAIVKDAGCENGGLLIDTWHLSRSGGTLSALERIPGELISAVQLSDAPEARVENIRQESHDQRLIPGDGCLDLVGTVQVLDRIGSTAPIGVEVASAQLRGRPVQEVANVTRAALQAILDGARTEPYCLRGTA